jgi:hypothetical protein
MTRRQIELLRDLIAVDREYWLKRASGEPVHRDERGIEIWKAYNGVDPRTVDSLVDAGLVEVVNIRSNQNWVFLGKYDLDSLLTEIDPAEGSP